MLSCIHTGSHVQLFTVDMLSHAGCGMCAASSSTGYKYRYCPSKWEDSCQFVLSFLLCL